MKLKFTRNQSGDVEAEILRGTTMEPFNYIEMLKQLMVSPEIEDPIFEDLDENQQNKIKELLGKIKDAVVSSISEANQ